MRDGPTVGTKSIRKRLRCKKCRVPSSSDCWVDSDDPWWMVAAGPMFPDRSIAQSERLDEVGLHRCHREISWWSAPKVQVRGLNFSFYIKKMMGPSVECFLMLYLFVRTAQISHVGSICRLTYKSSWCQIVQSISSWRYLIYFDITWQHLRDHQSLLCFRRFCSSCPTRVALSWGCSLATVGGALHKTHWKPWKPPKASASSSVEMEMDGCHLWCPNRDGFPQLMGWSGRPGEVLKLEPVDETILQADLIWNLWSDLCPDCFSMFLRCFCNDVCQLRGTYDGGSALNETRG